MKCFALMKMPQLTGWRGWEMLRGCMVMRQVRMTPDTTLQHCLPPLSFLCNTYTTDSHSRLMLIQIDLPLPALFIKYQPILHHLPKARIHAIVNCRWEKFESQPFSSTTINHEIGTSGEKREIYFQAKQPY